MAGPSIDILASPLATASIDIIGDDPILEVNDIGTSSGISLDMVTGSPVSLEIVAGGIKGDPGEPGEPGGTEDIGDVTLYFENGLV